MSAGASLLCLWTLLGSAEAQTLTSSTSTTRTASAARPSEAVDPRDAAMFGGDDADASGADRDAAMFGGDDGAAPARAPQEGEAARWSGDSEARVFGTLEETADRLAIGGRAFLRLDYFAVEDTDPELQALASPSFFDLYLDARPNERVRGYLRGRLRHDFTVTSGDPNPRNPTQTLEPTRVQLDQLWLKFDAGRTVFFTVGKQRVRWGTGRFWNPSDFLNQERLNPLAVMDERLGVTLMKAHLPVESLGLNLYAIAVLEGAQTPEQVGGAFRLEWLLGLTELSVSATARKDQPSIFGFDVSSGVWVFDLKAELALLHDVRTPFWDGTFLLTQDELILPTERDRRDDLIPQLVLGAEVSFSYSDEDSAIVGVEYFYNDAGYSDPALYPWLGFRQIAYGEPFPFLFLGRHYLAAYALFANPGSWNDTTFLLSALSNLSDRTAVLRFDYRATLLTYLRLNVYVNGHLGKKGGELRFGVDLPAIEGVTALADGFTIPTQQFEAGVGFILDF